MDQGEETTKITLESKISKVTSQPSSILSIDEFDKNDVSLAKRDFNKGENEGKKVGKNPEAKKGYPIVDFKLRLDKGKRVMKNLMSSSPMFWGIAYYDISRKNIITI